MLTILPSIALLSAPGWAGKTCTGVAKLHSSSGTTYYPFGIKFHADGSKYDSHGASTVFKDRDVAILVSQHWELLTTVYYNGYKTLQLADNAHVTFGFVQSNASQPNSLFHRGLQNTGMTFSNDFTTLVYNTGLDFLSDAKTREMLEFVYPDNFFCAFDGLQWHKDPWYFAQNGNADEKTKNKLYLKCV